MKSITLAMAVVCVALSVLCSHIPAAAQTPSSGSAASQPTSAPAGKVVPFALQKGDFVAIAGDSITEFLGYSRLMEEYLVACRPDLEIRCVQLGWSGDFAFGFLRERMDRDCLAFHPTVMTTCFGMNDGYYRPMDEKLVKTYRDSMQEIIAKAKKAGIRVVAGGPGVVDPAIFKMTDPTAYNAVLRQFSEDARKVSAAEGVTFADLYGTMMKSMTDAKAKLGKDYLFISDGGVHPGPNGYLVMAYVFLKQMGLDGNIGTITVDLSGKATATDGHKVLSAKDGVVEVESSRYPFCLAGDTFGNDTRPDSAVSILPFVPFNEELNRLMLVVPNLPSEKATVTWGTNSKTFTKQQLAAGVNLAAEFRKNPFCEAFAKLDQAVVRKQLWEQNVVKRAFAGLSAMAFYADKDEAAAAEDSQFKETLIRRHRAMQDRLHAMVTPIRHTIKIEPVK